MFNAVKTDRIVDPTLVVFTTESVADSRRTIGCRCNPNQLINIQYRVEDKAFTESFGHSLFFFKACFISGNPVAFMNATAVLASIKCRPSSESMMPS